MVKLVGSISAALAVILLCAHSATAANRDKRLFLVSSSFTTTTTTLSATTICYSQNAADTAACVRKKRSSKLIFEDPISGKVQDHAISPSSSGRQFAEEGSTIDGSLSESEAREKRVLYWMTTTTTTTSTSTTYTRTFTLATIDCTPSGFTLNVCPRASG